MRRELNYGPAEWQALPWQWQRTFIEKLIEKGLLDPAFVVAGGESDEPSIEAFAALGADVG